MRPGSGSTGESLTVTTPPEYDTHAGGMKHPEETP